jgi:hypothetical protein
MENNPKYDFFSSSVFLNFKHDKPRDKMKTAATAAEHVV